MSEVWLCLMRKNKSVYSSEETGTLSSGGFCWHRGWNVAYVRMLLSCPHPCMHLSYIISQTHYQLQGQYSMVQWWCHRATPWYSTLIYTVLSCCVRLTVLCRNCNRLAEKQHWGCPLERFLFKCSHSGISSSHKHRCSHLNAVFCSPTRRALFSSAFVSSVRVHPHPTFTHTFEHYSKAGNWGLENIPPLGKRFACLFIFLTIHVIGFESLTLRPSAGA